MDTDDETTAQQVLRINTNGLGFSTTGINGPYTNAWTIDGSLVADFITTGHMELDRLRGGTAILGGGAGGVYGNGTLTIKDASNNNIASISNTGITFNSNNFKVDNQGKMTAKSATIEGNITVGGSSNVNGSITIKNASGSIICTINNAGINYGNNAFKVSNTGVLSATGADIKGTVTVGGNSNADGSITVNNSSGAPICTINNSGINYGNGAFKVNATGNLTATGADISGKIVSNGTGEQASDNVTINNGWLSATTGLTAPNYGITGQGNTYMSNLNGGTVSAPNYRTVDGGTVYVGVDGSISWASVGGDGHALTVKNGLVVGIV
jgi:phage-related protein